MQHSRSVCMIISSVLKPTRKLTPCSTLAHRTANHPCNYCDQAAKGYAEQQWCKQQPEFDKEIALNVLTNVVSDEKYRQSKLGGPKGERIVSAMLNGGAAGTLIMIEHIQNLLDMVLARSSTPSTPHQLACSELNTDSVAAVKFASCGTVLGWCPFRIPLQRWPPMQTRRRHHRRHKVRVSVMRRAPKLLRQLFHGPRKKLPQPFADPDHVSAVVILIIVIITSHQQSSLSSSQDASPRTSRSWT